MNIRPASSADRDAILALVRRLAERGTPPGRDERQIAAVDMQTMTTALGDASPQSVVLVAEESNAIIGFVHVRTVTDYYTQASIGHVSDIVVQQEAEGKGVGHALIEAAQAWARSQGYVMMQLYVLPENTAARKLYERMGYRAEWLKYVKPLS